MHDVDNLGVDLLTLYKKITFPNWNGSSNPYLLTSGTDKSGVALFMQF